MNENLIVSLKDIVVEFDGQKVLDGLSLDIHDKEFVTFLGPSGCGKTTTLRVIAGFITPKSGNVFFDGKDIANMPPYKRPVNTVFQKYALFPHLNVFENVAFGLRLKKMTEEEIRPKVLETTALGAAYLAGLAAGIWKSTDELREFWELDDTFVPQISEQARARQIHLWHRAVERARNWAEE